MAAQKVVQKRKRNRKARTEVSSPSSSDSEESNLQSGQIQTASGEVDRDVANGSSDTSEQPSDGDDVEPVFPSQPPKETDPEKAFEDFYLRQATKEFASDLDKLRSSSDFNDRSVPMLIVALKQGTACFKPEERRKIGLAAIAADAS